MPINRAAAAHALEQYTEAAKRGKVRAASQVYAEAIAIIALREVMRSITPHDTPEGIQQRIRDLIAVKSTAMGLDAQNFDAKLEESDETIAEVDAHLARVLAANRNKGIRK